MDYEQCEIVSNIVRNYLVISDALFQFVAKAVGPNGTYIAARSVIMPDHEHRWWNTFLLPTNNVYEPDDTNFHREYLDNLVNHLVRVGWEPLAQSANNNWWSKQFRRSVLLYLPDPESSNPYTVGDEIVWGEKVLKASQSYKGQKDVASCRKLADSLMQFGLALERIHELDDAFEKYDLASVLYKQINAVEEAAKAYRWTQRIKEFLAEN